MVSNEFSILEADLSHAIGICNVLRRSIQELCIADYNNDPNKLADWLSNKTPENISKWIIDPSNYSLVALNIKGELIGVSMISIKGEILLNYLLPEYLMKGIGKCMLHKMELFAKKSNIKKMSAISTITALDFYKRNGFKESKVKQRNKKIDGIHIVKILIE